MKKYFTFLFLFLYCCFSLAAQPVEYTITASELEQLEIIYRNWEKNKQALQLQVVNLKAKLNGALTKSETLKKQLSAERETSKRLRLSFSAYENAVQKELTKGKSKIENLQNKNARLKIAVVILSAVIFCGFVFLIVKFILKLKK